MSAAKPRDLARTPTGRTVRVLEVLPDHRRLCEYVDGPPGALAERVELPARLLFVVQSAALLPWRSRLP